MKIIVHRTIEYEYESYEHMLTHQTTLLGNEEKGNHKGKTIKLNALISHQEDSSIVFDLTTGFESYPSTQERHGLLPFDLSTPTLDL